MKRTVLTLTLVIQVMEIFKFYNLMGMIDACDMAVEVVFQLGSELRFEKLNFLCEQNIHFQQHQTTFHVYTKYTISWENQLSTNLTNIKKFFCRDANNHCYH